MPSEQSATPPNLSRSGRRKWGGIALLGLLLIAAGITLSAWLWLRSESFNRYAAAEIKKKLVEYGLRAEIGSFGFAWNSQTARLKDLKLYNQQTGQLIASVKDVELKTEIQDLYAIKLDREVTLQKLTLDGVEVFLEIDEQGKSNLEGVRNAPPKPGVLIFDSTSLQAALTNGAVHFKDRQRQLETDLGDLKINAQLSPQTPDGVTVQLSANASRASFEGREVKISKLDLAARVSPSGIAVEQISLNSLPADLKAKGKVENLSASSNGPRYGFDVEANVRTDQLAQFAFPTVAMRGPATATGRIEGEGSKYNFKGSVAASDLTLENTRLRGVLLPQVIADGSADSVALKIGRVNVQSVALDTVVVSGVSVSNVQGEIKINESETRFSAPNASIASVTWTDSKLTDLKLDNVTSQVLGDKYEVKAGARLASGVISGAQVNGATAKAEFNNTDLAVTEIKANALGGTVEADYTLPMAKGAPQKVKGRFTNLKTGDLLAIAQFKDVPVTGTASGELDLSFAGADLRSLNGTLAARFEGKANESAQSGDAIPLTGEVAITARGGVFNFDQFQLSTDVSKLTVTGTLAAGKAGVTESDLRVSLVTTQAEQLVQIARSFEAARPFITGYEPQLIGDLKFEGRVTGQPDQAVIEGDVTAATVGLRDALLGSLSAHIVTSPTELRVTNGVVSTSNGGSAKLEMFIPFDPKAQTGKLDAVIDRISLEAILAAAGSPDANQFLSGDVSGNANLTGLPGAPRGSAQINLTDGRIVNQPAQVAKASITFDSQQALLESLEVQLPKTRVTASGKLNLNDYAFQAQGKADQIELSALAESFELKNVLVEGTADAQLQVSGKINSPDQSGNAQTGKPFELDWESLKVDLTALGKNVRVNGRDTGELRLTAQTTPGGRIQAELVTGILATVTKDKALKPEVVKASIELRKPGRPITIESNLTDLDLTPIIATFAPGLGSQVRGMITGNLRIEGPSADSSGNSTLDGLRGGLTVTAIKLDVQDNAINIPTPLTIALDSSQIRLPATRISGQGVDLSLGGAIGLKDEAGMNFALNGAIDLEKLPSLADGLALIGTATVDARLTGSAGEPQVSGQVSVNNFGLSTGDLPIYLSNGVGTLRLAGDQITLDKFTAKANEGSVEVSGATKLEGLRPSEWKYEVRVNNVDLLYQELSAILDGTLTLNGTPQGQTLAGSIDVPQAEYGTTLDLDNLLAGGGTSGLGSFGVAGGGAPVPGIPPVNLNIRVEARDSVTIRSKQINAVGTALLTVGGQLSDPRISGRIDSEGGLVNFRGQRYEITTGALELPASGDTPNLKLVAESEVGGYRVYVGFVGPLDAMEVTLRSEPELARTDVLSLITTGRTETGTLTSQDLLRSGVGAAASLVSSGLISKPTEQLLGLSRFQIDPVLRPNSNPAARLTIGQQFSRDLYVSYSTNLGTGQEQTALAEYTFSNRFSALATFTQGGSSAQTSARDNIFTIELRGRRRFSLGFAQDLTAANRDPNEAITRLARPKLPTAMVEVSQAKDLNLSRSRLRELLPVMTQGFSQPLRRLGEGRLREHLQERGYFFAEVQSRCAPLSCADPKLQVFYDVTPNVRYDLKDIRIEGTQLVRYGDIAGELQSQPASPVGGIPFLKDLPLIGGYVRGLTSSDRLREDEETIRRKLVDLGFRNARVNSRLAFKPDDDELIVVFSVEEGVQSGVASIVLRGNAILDAQELRDVVPIKAGEAFSPTRARAGVQRIRQTYADRGFLQASAELQVVDVDEDSVQLVYTITEAARAVVGSVTINGTTKTGQGWVRRYLAFNEGDLLTPAKMRQTQRDLYATNAFREVNVRAEPVAGGDGSKQNVFIDLTEAKPLLLVYGLGYSTDDGARGLIELANTNLFGTLDSLSLRLRGSRREQFAQLAFTDLRPFGTKFPTTISVFYNRNNNLLPIVQRRQIINGQLETINNREAGQTFGLSRFAAFIQTERKLDERTSLRFRYNLERAKLFNLTNVPDTELTRNERAIRLGMFSLGITRDTRDSVLNPARGQLVSADYSIAASLFGGNESFNKFFATYQRYKTFAPATPVLKDTTLAFSTRIGLANAFRAADRNNDGAISDSERRLPISERFFSGGATTLRGFRFETAGPQDVLFNPNQPTGKDKPFVLPTLIPVGGDALAVFNFEMRYPISPRFRVVPFYDLGNVFRRISDFRWSGMTNTVGLGLRVNTPLGPIGVDYGFLLDPPVFQVPGVPGATLRQPRGTIHIRLGQTF